MIYSWEIVTLKGDTNKICWNPCNYIDNSMVYIRYEERNSVCVCSPTMAASKLIEYQWPQEKGSEWYMLQEQVTEYLDIVSFKRKYPGESLHVMGVFGFNTLLYLYHTSNPRWMPQTALLKQF